MLKKKVLASASGFVVALVLVTVASASGGGATGDIVEITPPFSVAHGELESDSDLNMFLESDGVVLSENLRVDISNQRKYRRGTRIQRHMVSKGTEVDSYLLHSDPVGTPRRGVRFEGTVTFEEKVLGIIVNSRKLNATDDGLGSELTVYPDRPQLRGLERNRRADSVKLSRDGHTVTVRFKTSVKIDQVRVITAADSTTGEGDSNSDDEDGTLGDGLVGHWTFEDGSGQTVTDHSGNSNDGTLGSASSSDSDDPSWTSDSALGDYALEFDGENDLVIVGDQPEFEIDTYSWSLWLKAPESPSFASIGQPMSNSDEQFVASWDHTHPGFIASAAHKTGNDWVGVQIGSPLDGGEWYQISATYDGSELKIYLNGSLEESELVGSPNALDGYLQFGAGYLTEGPSSFFQGIIDEVRIYDRALTESEITLLAAR